MGKKRMNFTFEEDTAERLRQYAFEQHMTLSGALTQLVWNAKVTHSQLRGQQSFDLTAGKGKKK